MDFALLGKEIRVYGADAISSPYVICIRCKVQYVTMNAFFLLIYSYLKICVMVILPISGFLRPKLKRNNSIRKSKKVLHMHCDIEFMSYAHSKVLAACLL